MQIDKQYLASALAYATLGMALGVYMGASQHHEQHVTHAHILLVGFVTSFIYGVVHKLWPIRRYATLAKAQFIVHHAGALLMFAGLFLLFGGFVPETRIGPVLGIASVVVLIGVLLMLWMVLKEGIQSTTSSVGA